MSSAAGRMVQWEEVTAVFGGTFDPPHFGHREAVRGLFEFPGIRQVIILPTPSPPHKPCFASPEHRLAMVRLCFQPGGASSLPSHVEIDLSEMDAAAGQSQRPSYSFETLQNLRRRIPKLAFVIGADQLAALHTWYRFPELLELCHWIVLARRPNGIDVAIDTLKKWELSGLARKLACDAAGPNGTWGLRGGTGNCLKLVTTLAPAISSTEIREAISRTGLPPHDALLPEVAVYLKQHGLYGTNQELRKLK